ncbi:MAG: class B sortase [Lachnospiraceae bacterium]|nr:class B sortase [Lachnospiraceae bacterium]
MKKYSEKNRKAGIVLPVLMILCLGIMVFSLYKLVTISMEYRQSEKEYDILQSYITEKTEPEDEMAESAEQLDQEEETQRKAASRDTGCSITVDFEHLREINPDLVCWLYIPALELSYPVVQGRDNEQYLHHTFEGTENFAGSIFVDANIREPLVMPHTILYGHNMKNQTMFGKLKLLLQEELYREEPWFWILTPQGEEKYQIIDIRYTDALSSTYTLFEEPDNEYLAYLEEILAGTMMERKQLPEISENSRLVTLSTCASSEGTERLVVQGIAVESSP